jgi:hypothetical protein
MLGLPRAWAPGRCSYTRLERELALLGAKIVLHAGAMSLAYSGLEIIHESPNVLDLII